MTHACVLVAKYLLENEHPLHHQLKRWTYFPEPKPVTTSVLAFNQSDNLHVTGFVPTSDEIANLHVTIGMLSVLATDYEAAGKPAQAWILRNHIAFLRKMAPPPEHTT